jgi:hypothetical protein
MAIWTYSTRSMTDGPRFLFVPAAAGPSAATPLALQALDPFPFFCRVFFGDAAFLDCPPGVFLVHV